MPSIKDQLNLLKAIRQYDCIQPIAGQVDTILIEPMQARLKSWGERSKGNGGRKIDPNSERQKRLREKQK